VTTGFANHLARPLFRERQDDNMSEEAAVELMYDALRVCYYRDKQSINKFQLAKVRVGCGCERGGEGRAVSGARILLARCYACWAG
jgi:20S proteasome alpha/beta subunit